jgi:hypothetical protein
MNDQDLNRKCLAGSIDRDPVGRQLTPEARERAIDFAHSVFKGTVNNGQATSAGIKHVTAGIFKEAS